MNLPQLASEICISLLDLYNDTEYKSHYLPLMHHVNIHVAIMLCHPRLKIYMLHNFAWK
jgi:hypothetical protein